MSRAINQTFTWGLGSVSLNRTAWFGSESLLVRLYTGFLHPRRTPVRQLIMMDKLAGTWILSEMFWSWTCWVRNLCGSLAYSFDERWPRLIKMMGWGETGAECREGNTTWDRRRELDGNGDIMYLLETHHQACRLLLARSFRYTRQSPWTSCTPRPFGLSRLDRTDFATKPDPRSIAEVRLNQRWFGLMIWAGHALCVWPAFNDPQTTAPGSTIAPSLITTPGYITAPAPIITPEAIYTSLVIQ